MTQRVGVAMMVAVVALNACGEEGGSSEPVAALPQQSRVDELNAEDAVVLCEWAAALMEEKLPKEIQCNGTTKSLNSQAPDCSHLEPQPGTCPATVAEYRACMPNWFDYFAANACMYLGTESADDRLAMFAAIPGCLPMVPCFKP